MSNLDWLTTEDATVVALKPGDFDSDGDPVEEYTLVINNQWDGIGIAITSPTPQGFLGLMEKIAKAMLTLPVDSE